MIFLIITLGSCAGKKRIADLTYENDLLTNDIRGKQFELDECNKQKSTYEASIRETEKRYETQLTSKEEVIESLRVQMEDLKAQRTQQYSQVGDLTVLSKQANENINQTIKQLESRDKYIRYLQAAKTKTDSINLVLSANIKSVLRQGIADQDIDVEIDKTVVYINISDKMLFQPGSYKLTPRASEVLAKVATIVNSRPELDLMVEGYTDSDPISNSCIEDNWDLSVKRSSEVVRKLQKSYGINPNRLIAAGRGEYNALADNTTSANKAINRRTRIILLPKLNQFYDLLKTENINY